MSIAAPTYYGEFTDSASASSVAITGVTGLTGKLVFAAITLEGGSGASSVTSVDDTLGNTWTFAKAITNSPHNQRIELWYSENYDNSSSCDITATLDASRPWRTIGIFHTTGWDNGNALDSVSNSQFETGVTSFNTGTVLPTRDNALLIGIITHNGSITTDSPATDIFNTNGSTNMIVSYILQTSRTTQEMVRHGRIVWSSGVSDEASMMVSVFQSPAVPQIPPVQPHSGRDFIPSPQQRLAA